MVKILISYSKDINTQDEDRGTPLHYAAKNGHIEIVKILLAAEGIDINAKDKDEKTPFDLAKTEEIKTLLKKAAEKTDDVNQVDEPSSASEGNQEEDAGTREKEKQEGDAQSGSDVTNQEADKTVSSGGGTPQTQQGTNSAGQETQIGEQPSLFLSSLFNILTKPFSLIASFVGVFFMVIWI